MARWPTRLDYALSDRAVSDIEHLTAGATDLSKIIEAARALKPGLQTADILRTLSDKVGISVRDLRRVFNSLENTRDLADELGGPEQAIARLAQAVKSDIQHTKSDLAEKIEATAASLVNALRLYNKDNPVSLTFKAQRLTYNRERLFHEVEIISDARPIFDTKGEKVIEFVVTHSLVVSYFVNGEYQRQYYSVDNADILNLRTACDRAILKSRTLKDALGEKWPTEVLRDDTGS